MGERIAVTGASGVVGGAAARALLDRGNDVVAVQRGDVPAELRAAGARGFRADISGPSEALDEAFAGCTAVVHAAAKVDITGPWEDFERVNVVGTHQVLAAAQRAGVRRFVLVSSPSVAHAGYALVGAQCEPAVPERAHGHYSRSKAMAEAAVLSGVDPQMAVTVIRPHLVWGPGDTQLTARIIERARSGRLVLIGSGASLIDTTYIDNAGTAIAAAVDRAENPQVRGRAFVISNGEPRTVSEMLTRIAQAAGVPGPTRSVPFAAARLGGLVLERLWERTGREGEPPVTSFLAEQLATAHWFDQRGTRAALAWSPQVSLDEGFAHLAATLSGVAPGSTSELGL
ncbi:MAG: NAD-dependent epimerase/dehydratase family protein [Candidatus Nanopelagicales bacterium]